jgi:hypothetical protein
VKAVVVRKIVLYVNLVWNGLKVGFKENKNKTKIIIIIIRV